MFVYVSCLNLLTAEYHKVNFMQETKSKIIIPNSNYQMWLQKLFEHFIPNVQIT